LLLPGVGDHYVGMAHDLYETRAVFKQEVDRCADILEPHLGIDIRTVIYPNSRSWKREGKSKGIDLKKMLGGQAGAPGGPDATNLNRTLFVQPALFTIEYAMARLWQSLGITPDAIVGHSMGEYVAACLAGVMSLEEALRLIVARAKLVNELPQGAMLAVMLPENELVSLLPEDLSISLINGPSLCVVAGPVVAVAEFEKMLSARSVICRHVQNAHAFHSRMLDPIVKAFEAEVGKVRLNEPRIPYMSNVTGTWIAAREATDPAYWAMHANHTARFSDALHELWQLDNPILLEAGPGRTLGVLATQHPDRRRAGDPVAVSSMRHHYENGSDVAFLWQAIGKLWVSGTAINWDGAQIGANRCRVSLPTYPFESQKYWMEAMSDSPKKTQEQKSASENSGMDNWFYVPTWERTPFAPETTHDAQVEHAFWLIVADRYGGGAHIKSRLHALRQPAVFVRFGESFVSRKDDSFELNPAGIDDYLKLFRELEGRAVKAINIVHLGCLTRNDEKATHSLYASNQNFGFYSLLYIAHAIGDLNISVPIKIGIVSNRIHEVTGEEHLDPAMATVLGPCGVIPKEFPNVKCFNIDLPDNQAIENLPHDVLAAILSEFTEPSKSRVVAYRGRYRWERRYDHVKLPKTVPASAPDEPAEIRRLRRGGVYLITGGTGGIGLSIAKYLAKTCRPRIVLTKKSAFPERSKWRHLLNSKEAPEAVVTTIKELLEIERLGAEVEVFVAEASDRETMREVVSQTLKRFQVINGVIHAAGIIRPHLIKSTTKGMADSVLSPKVDGTMVLFDLFKGTNLDFMVLFSSMASVLGPYAHADYSAANCFLDAFANYSNSVAKFHTVAINWPVWKEVGIGAGSSYFAELEALLGVEDLQEEMLKKAILTDDGLEAFKRALNSDHAQIIVSPESLNQLLEQSQAPFDPTMRLSRVQNDGGEQPTNEVETAVAEMWASVFGIEQLGIHDNFSQLGGHSLLAMQIVAKIRSSYQIGFTLREFFATPTIAQLSSVVQARISGESKNLSHDQARPLVAPMGQRFFCASRIQKIFFVGPSNQQVFASYHPPVGGGSQVLTVICPPLFNEYMRTQLALRELAISLAERGQHVLRFDYRGTGDSSGDLGEVAVSHWLEDIALAVREGRDLSGSSIVRLLGVRAGALLACRSVGASVDVQRLVLWDPVPDGASHLRELRRMQEAVNERGLSLSRAERRETLHDYAGYRLSEGMVNEFRLLDASAYSSVPKNKLHVVNTSSVAGFPVHGVPQYVARFACNWETDLDDLMLMMPKPVLERLCTCLTMF
jgi:malonyl CoA-acyl carrier protein transacylase/acyl carrier protein